MAARMVVEHPTKTEEEEKKNATELPMYDSFPMIHLTDGSTFIHKDIILDYPQACALGQEQGRYDGSPAWSELNLDLHFLRNSLTYTNVRLGKIGYDYIEPRLRSIGCIEMHAEAHRDELGYRNLPSVGDQILQVLPWTAPYLKDGNYINQEIFSKTTWGQLNHTPSKDIPMVERGLVSLCANSLEIFGSNIYILPSTEQ